MSRPTKFLPQYIPIARMMARLGATDAQLAEALEVTEQTVNNWKTAHPEFKASLAEGKAEADSAVEKALFERATGYTHPDVHISNFQGSVTITPITKHYPPDTTACIFWLKNRKSGEWRDKQQVDHGVTEQAAEILKRIRSSGS